MSRNGVICQRRRRSLNRLRDFRVVDERGTRDRTCRRCRGEINEGRDFVRCRVIIGFSPNLEGLRAEGAETPVTCAALVFRGREAQHLEQDHAVLATPELVEAAFVALGGTDR